MNLLTIHIGGMHASRTPITIKTVLGSCVAVCLYGPVVGVGGMNHILLPGKADAANSSVSSRYAIDATEQLIDQVTSIGASRRRLVAKAFGGAHILPAFYSEAGTGSKNVSLVVKFLERQSIPLVSQDFGGYDSRRIFFSTATGEVLLKRIPCSHAPGPRDLASGSATWSVTKFLDGGRTWSVTKSSACRMSDHSRGSSPPPFRNCTSLATISVV